MRGFEFEFDFEGGFAALSPFVSRLLFAAILLVPQPLLGQGGQGAQAVLGQDTANVGDVVPVGIRVVTAPGERVAWPDTLPLAGTEAENAVRVTEQVDTLDDGRLARTGVYAITPWRTGELELPEVAVEVVGGDESPRTVEVALPSLLVVTVLPPDSTARDPKPARGVLGASWDWLAMGLILLLAAAVVGALYWWWRRRRGEVEEETPWVPTIPPRERALAALQEARDSGLVERGEWKPFYTLVSEAVRDYAAALEPTWSEDLTTTELLSRFRAQVGLGESISLGDVLRPADQVKFARREPDREAALAEWESARQWVRGFDWPPPRVAPEEVPEEAA